MSPSAIDPTRDGLFRSLFDVLGNPPAVHRLEVEQLEDQQIRRPSNDVTGSRAHAASAGEMALTY
jgi:hypothetical protein